MGLKSYSPWYDYSRARDEMFQATDTPWAPRYVVRSDDKKRARLNCISHLLRHIPYEEAPREKVRLPERQKKSGDRDPAYPFKFVPERASRAGMRLRAAAQSARWRRRKRYCSRPVSRW